MSSPVTRPSSRLAMPRKAGVCAALGVLAGVALSGCSGEEVTRTFGLTRDAPDEFQVTTRAPLSMPPDFSLRPPRPGATRPQEETSSASAESTLVPQASLANDAGNGRSSPGQQALVGSAGPAAPPTSAARSKARRRSTNPAGR